jgi:hypothetical protein
MIVAFSMLALIAICSGLLFIVSLNSPPLPPNVMEAIAEMFNDGCELSCGRHLGLSGFYAAFFESSDDEDSEYAYWDRPSSDWWEAGHANSLTAAILMAARVRRGEPTNIPGPEDF